MQGAELRVSRGCHCSLQGLSFRFQGSLPVFKNWTMEVKHHCCFFLSGARGRVGLMFELSGYYWVCLVLLASVAFHPWMSLSSSLLSITIAAEGDRPSVSRASHDECLAIIHHTIKSKPSGLALTKRPTPCTIPY